MTDPDPASATLNSAFTVTTAPPAQSLLAGCSVNANNTPSCSMPSGWSFVAAQGFETGALGPNEYVFGGLGNGNKIVASNAHTGTHVLQGYVQGDGNQPGWGITSAGVGSFHDLYVSLWTYLDSSARLDTEMFFNRLVNSANTQDCKMDTQQYTNGYTVTSAVATLICEQPNNPSGPGVEKNFGGGFRWSLNLGTWEQEEWWIHPNSCSGTTPNKDGFSRFYVNGQLKADYENVNINGWLSMSSSNLETGGVVTSNIGQDASHNCVSPSNAVTFKSCNPFTYCARYEADGVTPCVNHGSFNKYLDDIIVLKR